MKNHLSILKNRAFLIFLQKNCRTPNQDAAALRTDCRSFPGTISVLLHNSPAIGIDG